MHKQSILGPASEEAWPGIEARVRILVSQAQHTPFGKEQDYYYIHRQYLH